MQRAFLVFLLIISCFLACAQKGKYDSIKKILQQDSLEYEQNKKNADRIKSQADSMMRNALGYVERITTQEDTAAMRKKLHQIAEQELQKREYEAKRNYYLYVGVFAFLTIMVIWLVKRNQFAEEDGKKP